MGQKSVFERSMRLTRPQGFQKPLGSLLWLLPLLFLVVFYFYPLASILWLGLGRAENGLLTSFLAALVSQRVRSVIGFTIWQASLSTLLTLLVGLPGAYILARYDFPGKAAFRAISAIPFVMPTLVVAAGFSALFGPAGWVNSVLMAWLDLPEPPIRFVNSLGAILTAHVFYNTTIVLRLVGDYWSHLDRRLPMAAQTLGASRLRTWIHVTLPLLRPALLAAALLVFIFDFSSFAVVLVLGGPRYSTLEVEIFYQTTALFNLPLAAVLSIIQLGCTLVLTVIYSRLSERLARPGRIRSSQTNLQQVHTWRDRLLVAAVVAGLLIFLTAPLLATVSRSITQPALGRGSTIEPGLTLAFYRSLAEDTTASLFRGSALRAVFISLGYASATVVMALVLGLPIAWVLVRSRGARLGRWLDPILMLPLGTSAVTLGLGFIVALNRPPLDLRASPLLIPLAHTLVAFPFVVRSLAPSLATIQPRLRQAAAVLGASPWRVWWLIDLPLIGRAIFVAAAFAFTISLGEFGATALIVRPEFPTVPFAIYRFLGRPGALNYGQAMAMSTLLIIVTAAGILAIERLRIGEVGEF